MTARRSLPPGLCQGRPDRDRLRQIWPAVPHPTRKAGRKQCEIDPVHQHCQPATRRNAVMVRREPAKKFKMLLTPQTDRVIAIAIRNRPANRPKQDLRQRIGHAMLGTRVIKPRKMLQRNSWRHDEAARRDRRDARRQPPDHGLAAFEQHQKNDAQTDRHRDVAPSDRPESQQGLRGRQE